ncbi:MAG: hypothetical protein ACFE0J_06695 [Elainellaceae cyanobacterium]
MNSLPQLYEELNQLQAEVIQLQQTGDSLEGVRLEFTPAGGTASEESKQCCKYARLRAGKGKLLSNGQKSQYVKLSEISHYQGAIARGKRLKQLRQKISRVRAQIERGESIASQLGLPLPNASTHGSIQ